MSNFLAHWFTTAVALGVAAWVLPGVHVTSLVALLAGAIVLGLVNALVRPVLAWITLPLTVVTLGLFYLVVNGICFGLAAFVVPGFNVDSFGAAVLGSLVVALVSWLVAVMTEEPAPKSGSK